MYTPLESPSIRGRIDVYTGTSRSMILHEHVAMMKKWLPQTPGKLLYLNTLASEWELGDALRRGLARMPVNHRSKLIAQYVAPDDLWRQAKFLEAFVKDQNVRVIVLNSFDWAALTSYKRRRLVGFLKRMKDLYDVHVVVNVWSKASDQTQGWRGLLSSASNSSHEAGDWLKEYRHPSKAELAAEDEAAATVTLEELDLPQSPYDPRTNALNYDLPSFLEMQDRSLKNKILQPQFSIPVSEEMVAA